MQQPFNQPGGSYGNAPYAAPPRRGFNWLGCCLGCFGIAVLIAVVLGVVGYNVAKKASGPPITSSNFRTEFPADVPVYPGLVLDEKTTAAMRFAGGFVGLIPKSGGAKLRLMGFQCRDNAQTVAGWYKQNLTPKGYTTRIQQGRNGTSWEFEKRNTTVMISGNERQSGMIVIGIGTNMPRGGHMEYTP